MYLAHLMTSLLQMNRYRRSKEEKVHVIRQPRGQPTVSLLFICVAAVAGGLQWFQSGDLTNEALCHFLTANSFSCVYSLPPPTRFTLISSQLFQLSLTLVGKKAKVMDSSGVSFLAEGRKS